MSNLDSLNYSAPGIFVTESSAGTQPSSVVSFSSAYFFIEVEEQISTNLITGLPYNVPVLISNLTELQLRLGGGNLAGFSVPNDPAALLSYNSIKLFFRNSDASTPCYVVRVKPMPGKLIEIKEPREFELTNSLGVTSKIYGYPLEIEGFKVGQVVYDSFGDETHVGIVVPANISREQATEQIINAILLDGPVSTSVYARVSPTVADSIEIYPRQIGQTLELESNIVVQETIDTGYSVSDIIANDDDSRVLPRVEARDYIYTIETALDPTVHEPGFIAAPAAFAKFNPLDRLRVGKALEARAALNDFSGLAVVDAPLTDGYAQAYHYAYTIADIGRISNLEDVLEWENGNIVYNPTSQTYQLAAALGLFDPIYYKTDDQLYVRETNEFYTVLDDVTDAVNIPMPKSFVSVTRAIAGQAISAGRIVEVATSTSSARQLRGVITSFTPVAGDFFATGANAGYIDVAQVTEVDTVELPLVEIYNPTSVIDQRFFPGQVVNIQGALYWCRLYTVVLANQTITTAQLRANFDADVPLAYYQEWLRVNTQQNNLILSTYNPLDVQQQRLGARNVPYNALNHSALLRDHLMYTTERGYLAYFGPSVIDLEEYEVPASSGVIGVALRRYREQGFQQPPAGAQFPLRGVIRPSFVVTQAHQQVSSKTGMNAIRQLPNIGTVVWGARTRSINPFYRFINTRVILNVVIASLRRAYDNVIFSAIDGQGSLFNQVRGTAEGILYQLFIGGALFGNSPSDAYRAICSDTNNPAFQIEEGSVNLDVYVVPVSTLERIKIDVIRVAIGQLNNV